MKQDDVYAILSKRIKNSGHISPEQVDQIDINKDNIEKNTEAIEKIEETGVTVDDFPSYSDAFYLLSEGDDEQ